MRIEIEIPKEFEADYTGDKFKDFFSRVLCDIKEGKCLCGNYEIEIAEMFIKAFYESKPAYDVEKVVEEMNKLLNEELHSVLKPLPDGKEYPEEAYRLLYLNTRLRGLIRNGGKE